MYGDTSPASCVIIKHSSPHEQYCQRIKEAFEIRQFLEHLTVHADMHMQQEEFDYLVDLKEGVFVCADDIIKAVDYLFKKNIFEQISITCTPGVCGICVHFELVSFLTLGRVKIRGVFTDKQKYTRCYVLDRGDRFDTESHERSLEKMKDACRREGYFNVAVTSVFAYDDLMKVVNPTITVSKGRRFSIGVATIAVRDDGYAVGDERAALEKKIYRIFLKRLIKKTYDKELLNRCALEIKEYLACKGFVSATITLDEHIDTVSESIRLSWRVDVQHKCSFVFWGNRFFSDHQLHQHMREFGRSAWLLPASLLAQEIERIYREKGFWNISIEIQEEKDRYFFMIKEGVRASIARIELVQASSVNEQLVIKNCFGNFLKSSYFDQELLESSFAAVRAFYEQEGFLDAHIVGHEIMGREYAPELPDDAYLMRVIIQEGDIKKCVGVEVPNFPELCMQGPLARIAIAREAVIFHPQLLNEQRAFLQQYAHAQGYRIIRLEPELRVRTQNENENENENTNEIVLVWHFECDKTPLRFGKTVVQGCCLYPFGRLMRELQYERGHLWRQDALKKTFLQFKTRAIFDGIYMHADNKNIIPGEKTVLLRLHHDDPFEVRLRVGVGFQNIQNYQSFGGLTYKLGSSFVCKNPTNRADVFSTHVDFARSHRELVMKYVLPWMFQLPCDGLVQAYSTKYAQPGFIGSKNNIYTITQLGVLGGVHKKMAHFDGEIHIGFEGMRTTVESGPCDTFLYAAEVARAINFTPRFQHKMVPFFFVEPTLYLDYLDDKLNPTCGTYTVVSAKSMMPLNARYDHSFFVKVLAEHAFFMPIRSCVAALRIRFGHIFYQEFNRVMPIERFYLGGSHSVRGYNADAAPPLGVFIDEKGEKQTVPRGGKTMMNGNAELRIPLMGKVGGVLFQDIGLLSSDARADIRPQNIVAASGLGLRIYTPVGPLRFDIGFNWWRHSPLESRFAWFLTFGQAF